MRPNDICTRLGTQRIIEICGQLNSNQLKSTLRKGDLNVKVPSRVVSQKARRKIWADRVTTSLEKDNEEVANSLLYEWLLHHRRAMLIEYLDLIGVKHQGGETEETFTKTVPADDLLRAARDLASRHSPEEVAVYLLFLDHHQESDVYTSAADIVAMLGNASTAAPSAPADAEAPADADPVQDQ